MPGLNEGLQKINKDGEIKLYVPPALGYGDQDSSSVISSVPANSVLLYDIKMLDIQDAPTTN
jgi:FKBP-type peptidyl-prolyl cis-trans isomerase